ncbi:MAG: hypothetical protein WA667_14945 [Candidatus Nitrosopolaris sp.]
MYGSTTPRYLPKNKENWDQWWKGLAPSKALFTICPSRSIEINKDAPRRILP